MFSVGLMANTGADFFSLFGPEDSGQVKKIRFGEVVQHWELIDRNHDGAITKQDAAVYMAQKKGANPLSWVMHRVASHFDIEENFAMLIGILAAWRSLRRRPFLSRDMPRSCSRFASRGICASSFSSISSRLPMSFYQEHNLGSLSSRAVGDAGQIAMSINSLSHELFANSLYARFDTCSSVLNSPGNSPW